MVGGAIVAAPQDSVNESGLGKRLW